MPVTLNFNTAGPGRPPRANRATDASLAIGLINNMSDSAVEPTERRFISLLDSTSNGITIHLSLYSLPGVPRSRTGACNVSRYASVESLWDTQLDGLIVTGREPRTEHLPDEPYWQAFTELVDWAQQNTGSTVWSCLAAHAAVLHLDGIDRIKSDRKYCGIFDCTLVSDHPITERIPARFQLPHSRWNGIEEETLTSRGYRVLTRSPNIGVDTFIKQRKSLFVFFQGHPEYESNTLLLEYRRDVGHYLKGKTNEYPRIPKNYFARDTVLALTALQREAVVRPREDLLAEVASILERAPIENTWSATAAGIYGNWLQYLCARKGLPLHTDADAEAHRPNGCVPTLAAAMGV